MKKIAFIALSIVCYCTYAKSRNPIIIDSTVVVDNNIKYKVVEDPLNFFITLETDDRKASRTILREGVTVYFDIKGKKKKNVFVRYPNKVLQSKGRRQQGGQRSIEEAPKSEESIETLPQQAFYSHFNTEREFHILLNDLHIEVNLEVLEQHRIKYRLKIPKNKINDDPKKDLSKLTIGILIGRDRTDNANQRQRSGGDQSGMQMGGGMSRGGGRSSGGMAGGGRTGGGMQMGGGMQGGGGRSGGGMQGQQRPSQDNRTQATAFWFEVNPN